MNIKKITNKLTLWKNIDNFYSFNELIYLSNQYYEGVRVLFAASDCIFDFNFYGIKKINPLINKKETTLEVTYNELLFSKFNGKNDPNDINHDYNPWFRETYTFYKEDFKNQLQIKIFDQLKNDDCIIKKFCLLSELYQDILNGVNI